MSEYEFIPPHRAPIASFSVEPAYNVLCSLLLLNSDLSGFGEWVHHTAALLTPEQKESNELVCSAATDYLGGGSWPTFTAWLDDIALQDAYKMRDAAVTTLLSEAGRKLGVDAKELPTFAEVLANRAAYALLKERLCKHRDVPCEPALYEVEHTLLLDPVARQERILTHLRQMWDQFLASEWERNLPMLEESVAAFESLDYRSESAPEIVCRVTARERVPPSWDGWLSDIEHFVFVPSAHIGPYLILMDRTDTVARIVFGARIPEGATIVSPALNRSELLIRLSALADETRLRILELLAQHGELGAQEVIGRLEISQSTASRHLRQLGATGYVIERRQEGAKVYRLNPDRLDETLDTLKGLLR